MANLIQPSWVDYEGKTVHCVIKIVHRASVTLHAQRRQRHIHIGVYSVPRMNACPFEELGCEEKLQCEK